MIQYIDKLCFHCAQFQIKSKLVVADRKAKRRFHRGCCSVVEYFTEPSSLLMSSRDSHLLHGGRWCCALIDARHVLIGSDLLQQ